MRVISRPTTCWSLLLALLVVTGIGLCVVWPASAQTTPPVAIPLTPVVPSAQSPVDAAKVQAAAQAFEAAQQRLVELASQIEQAENAYTTAAVNLYKADPTTRDPVVVRAVVEALVDMMQRDDFENALELVRMMIDAKYPNPGIYEIAGVAATNTGELDAAEGYLKLAQEANALGQMGMRALRQIPELKADWAKEKEIRAAEAQASDLPRVLLKTSKGDLLVELFENEAPNTVANFISLVQKGYYDGLTFHRVLPGFMAQGGCPTGDGTGGPGYNIPCECWQENARKHFRGSLSMAHAGRDSGGSQFFLTFVPTTHLNPNAATQSGHTVFGRVIEGWDVLGQLRRRDPNQPGQPEPDKIIEATVVRKRPHEYVPKTLPEPSTEPAAEQEQ